MEDQQAHHVECNELTSIGVKEVKKANRIGATEDGECCSVAVAKEWYEIHLCGVLWVVMESQDVTCFHSNLHGRRCGLGPGLYLKAPTGYLVHNILR